LRAIVSSNLIAALSSLNKIRTNTNTR
jgi:hypothetical protein